MDSDQSVSEADAAMQNGTEGDHEDEPPTDDLNGADDADLFGDGSEAGGNGEDAAAGNSRKHDDEELDSGDDEGRRGRREHDDMDGYGDDEEDQGEARSLNVADVRLARHPVPCPSDGELYLFQLPKQLGIEPRPFHHSTFEPPTTDHHSDDPPSSTFSVYQTAISTSRWRFSPSNPSKLQSNARVIRWEDGSLTVQLASNAREQYALSAKALAPPQLSPRKPVPTAKRPGRVTAATTSEGYDARLDSHTYLVTPHESAQILRITNHITASLTVQSSSVEDDDALIRLQERMAAAKANKTSGEGGGIEMLTVKEDPELAKLKAEAAEKEKIKAQRKRQQQEDRERDRANRVLGRSGLRTGGYGAGGGLTVGGLEGDDGMATTRPSRPGKPRKKPRRRNSEYSDDEDFRSRGRTKEDEYDADDGFLVRSDEELEIVDDASEEEEIGEEDAEGEDVEEEEKPAKAAAKREATDEGPTSGRVKRRRVIDEDEDE